jgi:hypothetical protein
MSKVKTVVPKVPSAKTLARYQTHLDALRNPEAKAMLLEAARIHDENEDRDDRQTAAALDELSPHARAAVERLLGKTKDFEAV